jgi:hypothetical protein
MKWVNWAVNKRFGFQVGETGLFFFEEILKAKREAVSKPPESLRDWCKIRVTG